MDQRLLGSVHAFAPSGWPNLVDFSPRTPATPAPPNPLPQGLDMIRRRGNTQSGAQHPDALVGCMPQRFQIAGLSSRLGIMTLCDMDVVCGERRLRPADAGLANGESAELVWLDPDVLSTVQPTVPLRCGKVVVEMDEGPFAPNPSRIGPSEPT